MPQFLQFSTHLLHLPHYGQLLLHLAVYRHLQFQLILLVLFSNLLQLGFGVLDAFGPVDSGDKAILVAFLDDFLAVGCR